MTNNEFLKNYIDPNGHLMVPLTIADEDGKPKHLYYTSLVTGERQYAYMEVKQH